MRRAMMYPEHYHYVLDLGYVCITLLYLTFATIGYLGYGDLVNPDGITLNLPSGSPWTLVTQISLIFAIFATYPVQMFPVVAILEGYSFHKIAFFRDMSHTKQELSRNLIRLILVFVTSLVAVSIPYFSLFVSLVGALGGSMMAYILPCVFHIKLFSQSSPRWKVIFHWALVIFGVVAAIVASTVTIIQLIEAVKDTIQSS
jgi:solute carrier family 36 (proton-coupled amino acid transporter)